MANVASDTSPERGESGSYLKEVWSELRKTVWPTWPELRQMTGVVIVTVVLMAAFLGLVDFGLTAALAPLYTTTSTPAATPTPTAVVTPTPSVSPVPSATPSAAASATP
ncbi:MAG: preprotein translocase subunit SecE [Candidatus Dormibacteria bacterium]